jgi:hypothetical protein
MLQIKISDTGESATLSIINPQNGVDYIGDFVGNSGALIDGQFIHDGDSGYICTQSTFDWWQNVVSDCQQLEERLHQLTNNHGAEAVRLAIGWAGACDLEDYAARVNQALDTAFPED